MNKNEFIKDFFEGCQNRELTVSIDDYISFHVDAIKFRSIPETELILPKNENISSISVHFRDEKKWFGHKFARIIIQNKNCIKFNALNSLADTHTPVSKRSKLMKILAYICRQIEIEIYTDTMKLSSLSYVFDDDTGEQWEFLINCDEYAERMFSKHYEEDDEKTIFEQEDKSRIYYLGELKDGSKCYIDLRHYSQFSYSFVINGTVEFEKDRVYYYKGEIGIPTYRNQVYKFDELIENDIVRLPESKAYLKSLFIGYFVENQKEIYQLMQNDIHENLFNTVFDEALLRLRFKDYIDKFDTGSSELDEDEIRVSADRAVQ